MNSSSTTSTTAIAPATPATPAAAATAAVTVVLSRTRLLELRSREVGRDDVPHTRVAPLADVAASAAPDVDEAVGAARVAQYELPLDCVCVALVCVEDTGAACRQCLAQTRVLERLPVVVPLDAGRAGGVGR